MTTELKWLAPGEDLLWSGRPHPLRYALRRGWLPFLLGALMLAGALAGKSNLFGVLWGTVLILSPAWHCVRAVWTTYALTNRRAVIDISGGFSDRAGLSVGDIQSIKVRQSANGSGNILFRGSIVGNPTFWFLRNPIVLALDGFFCMWPRRDGFLAIRDVSRVKRLLDPMIRRPVASLRDKAA
jgi:hypothetical protein